MCVVFLLDYMVLKLILYMDIKLMQENGKKNGKKKVQCTQRVKLF